jgi:hypothetical protein
MGGVGTVHSGRSDGQTFAGYSDLEVTVCTCGVLFAVPEKLLDTRRFDGESFYCPNGHRLSFDGNRTRLQNELARTKDRLASERARRDQTEASLRATKGVVTKLKKRATAGVCPAGCKRHFKDLERHMASKHPDFTGDKPAT